MPTPAEQIRESYREAVACAIEGTDNFEAWGCVYHALAKAILSAWLASAAKTAEDIPECEVTKILYAKSDCGAGKEGNAGFQPGNTCAGDGDGQAEKGESSHQTSSPEFKSWFGDSKVVDDSGEPLVMYHGTTASGDFEEFRGLTFLTDDPKISDIYAGDGRSEGGRVIPVYASVKNPFDTRNPEHRAIFEAEFYRKWGNGAELSENGLPDWTDAEDFEEFFEDSGYEFDGVYIQEPQGLASLAIFRPTQIKSAIGNTGDFDPDNPKITHKRTFAKKPDAFDELFKQFDIKPDFEVAPNWKALEDLEGRVPMVRQQVPEVEGMAFRLAEEVIAKERANIIPIMEKSSKAMQSGLRRAFWVSDVDAETVINLQNLLADAIRGVMPDKTLSLPEFINHAKLEGASNLTDARLETIFRTNVMTAANEGVMSVLRDEDAKDLYPLVMISEIDDDRSRPHHAAMDGYITTPGEMDRLQLRPPNGYNCRGNLIKITFDEADEMGLIDEFGKVDMVALRRHNDPTQDALIASGMYPDKGFKRGGGLL